MSKPWRVRQSISHDILQLSQAPVGSTPTSITRSFGLSSFHDLLNVSRDSAGLITDDTSGSPPTFAKLGHGSSQGCVDFFVPVQLPGRQVHTHFVAITEADATEEIKFACLWRFACA